jgi:hypothetical protein
MQHGRALHLEGDSGQATIPEKNLKLEENL